MLTSSAQQRVEAYFDYYAKISDIIPFSEYELLHYFGVIFLPLNTVYKLFELIIIYLWWWTEIISATRGDSGLCGHSESESFKST